MFCQLCQQQYPHPLHWESCPKAVGHPALQAFQKTCEALPGISVRLYNGLSSMGRQHLCTVGHVSLTAIQALPDRELLRWRNVGRKTLAELRRLGGDPIWDAWAATVQQAWRQQGEQAEVALAGHKQS